MDEPTIFYSWQSDTSEDENHYLIRDAAREAIKLLGAQADFFEPPPRLVHDTTGSPGIPGIAETIFKRIDNSAIFLCDLTHVATIPADRPENVQPCPNPNVAMELGYALCRVGEDRIIYVMNTAYGDAEGIMFNLKHRRWPIKYALSRGSNRGERKLACENLATSLASAIKTTLSAEHSLVEETIRRLDRQSLDAILAAIPRGYFSVKNDGTFGSLVSNLPMYMSIGRLLNLNVIWAEYSLGGQQKRYSYKLTYLGKLVAKEIQSRIGNGPAVSVEPGDELGFTFLA